MTVSLHGQHNQVNYFKLQLQPFVKSSSQNWVKGAVQYLSSLIFRLENSMG